MTVVRRICERLSYYLALLCFFASLGLIASSLITQQWIIARVTNAKVIAKVEGSMHAGLFSGVRVLDWGLGVRVMPFSVLSELQDSTSFFGRGYWLGTVSFTCFGMVFTILAILLTIGSGVQRRSFLGTTPCGMHICNALGILFLTGAALMFYYNYNEYMKENVLLQAQLEAGFNTTDKASLGYSFRLFVAAIVVLFCPSLLLHCFSAPPVTRQIHPDKNSMPRERIAHFY